MPNFAYCPCYGRGIIRNRTTHRYERCACGRLPGSWGTRKLAEQAAKNKRYEELKEKGWSG